MTTGTEVPKELALPVGKRFVELPAGYTPVGTGILPLPEGW